MISFTRFPCPDSPAGHPTPASGYESILPPEQLVHN
jgi:hypothetical protein